MTPCLVYTSTYFYSVSCEGHNKRTKCTKRGPVEEEEGGCRHSTYLQGCRTYLFHDRVNFDNDILHYEISGSGVWGQGVQRWQCDDEGIRGQKID